MKIKLKIIIPHLIASSLIIFILFIMFGAVMTTNNNGEFGYPEQGTYDWKEISIALLPWFLVSFIFLELPIILYQSIKNKIDKAEREMKLDKVKSVEN